ncbi:hypothetical protein [Parendozoicomonas haliclonae]|uniref:Serine/threonine-protein kinase PknD n=1 Tax=Parendozoicomonas haliclonae TaxID=1960125 RepID=A0A1X7AE96_9GAMM|nr:hypothetical protein [Parendozoicomonas haliclonae]SMA33740.1 hypothetical protein EHSB41UT_00326 [Parendozoicomonas haliclonae]
MKRFFWLRAWLIVGLIVGIVLVFGGVGFYVRFFPVAGADGWDVQVWAADIDWVSALALHPDGSLFVTQEKAWPDGTLLHLAENGDRQLLLDQLAKPDGLTVFRDGVALTQEGGKAPVLWYHDSQSEELFEADSAEGITNGQDRFLYTVEDRQGGRLLAYEAGSGLVSTLYEGGTALEGVSLCPNGDLYFCDKKLGKVFQFQRGVKPVEILTGLHKPGFLLCNHQGLWITEDATAHSRVLLWQNNQLTVIARHLRSAQTIIEYAPGKMLVAEQGRNRILLLEKRG